MSKILRIRPSELYRLSDELEAYWFDRAVTTFGMAVEADLDKASSSAKDSKKAEQARTRALNRWLDREQKFRDPAVEEGGSGKKTTGSVPPPVSSETDGAVVL